MPHTSVQFRAPILACMAVVCLVVACGGEHYTQSDSSFPTSRHEKPVPVDAGCTGVWCPPPIDCGFHVCADGGLEVPDSGTDAGVPDSGVEVTINNFGAAGLYTSPSFLNPPSGAALVADNLVVDKPGEYTTRRGFEALAAPIPGGYSIDAWTVYQGAVIAHTEEVGQLWRYVSGTWTAYGGNYYAPTPGFDSSGFALTGQVKFFEQQQALYFTTAAGVYRLEGVTGTPAKAGAVQALPGTAAVSVAGQALSTSSATAYRYVWGRRAANGRIMLGAPSDRVTVTNRSESFPFSPSAMSRTSNVVTLTVTSGVASNLLVGQSITLNALAAGADTTAFGPVPSTKVITAKTATTISYAEAGANATAASPGSASFTSVATGVKVAHVVQTPEGLDDTYFFQAYRSDEVPLNVTPSDEMYLVYEESVAEMAAHHAAFSLARVGGVVLVSMVEPHGLSVGSRITLTDGFASPGDATNFPPGLKVVTAITSPTTFQYMEAGPDVGTTGQAQFLWLFSYSFEDDTPDGLKADALYTNANAGGSVSTAHYAPPEASEATVFSNRAVYANIHLPERITLTVLAVGSGGLNIDMGIEVTDGSVTETYFGASSETATNFKIYTDGTPAQNISNTVQSLVRVINTKPAGIVYARYLGAGTINPGQFLIESRNIASPPLTIRALQQSPFIVPALTYRVAAADLNRSGNVTTVTTFTGYPHGFIVGQVIRGVAGTPDPAFPSGTFTVASVIDQYTFTINDPGPNAPIPPDAAPAGYMFYTTAPDVQTDDESSPGGFMVSDTANPDSVPSTLPEIVGDRYKRILRMLQVGNALFFLKEDGLYRLVGTEPGNYTTDCVDSTIRFVAPRAAWVLNGRAYALTTQGLATWTESSNPQPTALQIEDKLRAAVETYPDTVTQYAFGLAHESKRRAYLWLPDADGNANAVLYVLNATTGEAWTTWQKPAQDAFIHPAEDRLYVVRPDEDGSGTAPAPSRERNTGTSADYVDEAGQAIQSTLTWVPLRPPETTQQEQLVRSTYSFAGTVPTSINVAFQTDWNPTPLWFQVDSASSQSPGTLTTPPDLEHSRGGTHTLSIRHGIANQPLRVLGFSANMRYWGLVTP